MRFSCWLSFVIVALGCGGGSSTPPGDDDDQPQTLALAFQQQPSDAEAGAALAPAVTVAVVDDAGEIVTSAAGMIHLALGTNPGGAALSGTTDIALVGGVARFDDLAVTRPGTGYTLAATSDLADGSISQAFAVRPGVSVAMSAVAVTPASVAADGVATATVTVIVRDAAGEPFGSFPVSLAVSGTGNHVVPPQGLTDAQGTWTARIASTEAAAKVITVTAGPHALTAGVAFSPAPCTPRLPDVPVLTGGDGIAGLALADFDGDGVMDLAALETTQVALRLGAGDGRFWLPTRAGFAGTPAGIAAADLDGDARADAVVVTSGLTTASVIVYLGDGAGGLTAPTTYPISASSRSVAIGDLDGDGKRDVVVRAEHSVLVLLGTGNGQLAAPVTYDLGYPYSISTASVQLADMNGDGELDVVTADGGSNTAVLLGRGDGMLNAPISRMYIEAEGEIAVADFDGDSIPDLAVANYDSVYIGHGNGDGTFGATKYIPMPGFHVFATDADGDGKQDVLAVGAQIGFARGNGDGTFGAPSYFSHGGLFRHAAMADLDGDGHADVISGGPDSLGNAISVSRGAANGLVAPPQSFTVYPDRRFIASLGGDFNEDGRYDLIGRPQLQDGLQVIAGPALTPGPFTSFSAPSLNVDTAADFDGDGHLDVLVLLGNSSGVLRGGGDGTLAPPITSPYPGYASRAVAARLDAGTTLDLALTDSVASAVTIEIGTGTGTFSGATSYAVGNDPEDIVPLDVDGDGDQDLLVVCSNTPGLTLMTNRGDGTFTVGTLFTPSRFQPSVAGVAAADFDHDGAMDVVGIADSGRIVVLRGKGDGTFFSSILYPTAVQGGSLALADVDLDGELDVVVGGSTTAFLHGNGDATFAAPIVYPSEFNLGLTLLGDLDGDGRVDLIRPEAESDVGVTYARNAGCI